MKLALLLGLLAFGGSAYGGWIISKGFLSSEEPEPVAAAEMVTEEVDLGLFLLRLPGSIASRSQVLTIKANIDPASAPQKQAELRTVMHQLLAHALEMPLVKQADDVPSRLAWAVPKAGEKIAPWLHGVRVELLKGAPPKGMELP